MWAYKAYYQYDPAAPECECVLTTASLKHALSHLSDLSTCWRTFSVTLQSTLIGSRAVGDRNSLKVKVA